MELKYLPQHIQFHQQQSFNRTFMELKYLIGRGVFWTGEF